MELIVFLLGVNVLLSCSLSESEFREKVRKGHRVELGVKFHGGMGGSARAKYVLRKCEPFPGEPHWLLIRNEGTPYQTYIQLDSVQHTAFQTFVAEAFRTHDTSWEYATGCAILGPNPNEYDLKVNTYSRHLQPNEQTDSLFYALLDGFCTDKLGYE